MIAPLEPVRRAPRRRHPFRIAYKPYQINRTAQAKRILDASLQILVGFVGAVLLVQVALILWGGAR